MSSRSGVRGNAAWKATRRRYWQGLIKEWRRSGLRQNDFCRRRSVSYYSFCHWKVRLLAARGAGGQASVRKRNVTSPASAQAKPVQFLPVRVLDSADPRFDPRPSPSRSGIEVLIRGGRRVRVLPGFNMEVLKAVVRSLESLPC